MGPLPVVRHIFCTVDAHSSVLCRSAIWDVIFSRAESQLVIFCSATHTQAQYKPKEDVETRTFSNSTILSPSQPYLVPRDTPCSCEAYGMRPTNKEKPQQGGWGMRGGQ
jgi:hypothetical protein